MNIIAFIETACDHFVHSGIDKDDLCHLFSAVLLINADQLCFLG